MMEPRRITILKRPVHAVDRLAAIEYLSACIERGLKQFVVAQNPEKIVASFEDKQLMKDLETKATVILPDGIGVVFAAWLLGWGKIPRLTGIDLFFDLLKFAEGQGKRVFLYGATPEVSRAAEVVLRQKHPRLELVGGQHGYEKDEKIVLKKIEAANPDFLFVGLGSPRQEKWIARHFDELKVPCVMGVGGSFDILAGKVSRAPAFMRRTGTEWFYRLITEPTRARRIIALLKFVWLIAGERFKPKIRANTASI